MSIRPTVCTVFGMDNFTGSLPESFWERRVSIPEDNSDMLLPWIKDCVYDHRAKEWAWYPDVVYCCPQTSNRSVIGLIKSRDFDSDTFRVLALLYPELYKSGRKDVPLIKGEWERQQRLKYEPPSQTGGIPFNPQWLYPYGYHQMTPVWAYVTRWLLDGLGVKSDPGNYKWMLVWDWC